MLRNSDRHESGTVINMRPECRSTWAGKRIWAPFYRDRWNKVYEDATNDVQNLPALINRYSNTTLGTLDAKYIDWKGSYELNRQRYANESERWSQDVEPLFRDWMGHDFPGEPAVSTSVSPIMPNSLLFRFIAWARALSPEQVQRSRVPTFVLNWARNLTIKQVRRLGILGAGIESFIIIYYLIPYIHRLSAISGNDSAVMILPLVLVVWTLVHTAFLINEHRAVGRPLGFRGALRTIFWQMLAFAPYFPLAFSGLSKDAMETLLVFAVSTHIVYDAKQIDKWGGDSSAA